MGFELDSETRRRLGYKLIDHIDRYFSSLPDRPVQLPLEQRTFEQLRNRLPEIGGDAERVLDEVCREIVDRGFHVPSANYFGLMNPTPTYMAVLAEALVAALNPQLATMARSQLASKIEQETVRWIGERIGWTSPFDGTLTSGGNEANFSGLALALASRLPHAIEDGMTSAGVRPTVYASAESHHSLDKSTGLLGMGRKALRRVPVNEKFQIRVGELERAIERDAAKGYTPLCIVATAGTTNSGAVDDMEALADVCARRNLWLHVDGAYGAAAVFSDRYRNRVRGIERADSITIDPHKWLFMPFSAGVILTRHPEALSPAFEVATPYMPRAAGAASKDNFKVSTQWSRRMNSLKLWLTLRVHGRQAYEELIDRQLRLARSFADWVRQSRDYELVLEPELTIVNFRLKLPQAPSARVANSKEDFLHVVPDRFADQSAANNAVVDEVTRDGTRWISSTVAGGRSVIRMMVISYLTDERNLRSLQEALTAAAQKVRARSHTVET